VEIKDKIENLLKTLREERKDHLANVIEKNWDKTILDYSASLYKYKPVIDVEIELINAIRIVLNQYSYSPADQESIIESFKKYRIIQTAQHLDICNTPRMLLINWLSTRGLPEDCWYLAFAYSGIPYSNGSRPGAIKFSNTSLDQIINKDTVLYKTINTDLNNSKLHRNHELERISLVPSNMQDEIGYRSTIQNRAVEIIKNLTPDLSSFFPIPNINSNYSIYALNTSRDIERKILNIDKTAYLDINEITTQYLLQVLKNPNHIVTKILCDEQTRSILAPVIPTEAMFYASYLKDGKFKQESIFITNDGFTKSKYYRLNANSEDIINALNNDRLCPGLFLTYLVFKFVNGTRCLGSFVAAEYLPIYKEKLIATGILKDYNIESVPTDNLTTGMLPDKSLEQVTAIDVLLGTDWKPNENMLYGELLLSLMDVIYGRDFTK
jgi:hypothetical protein